MPERSTLPAEVGRTLTLMRERRHLTISAMAKVIGWKPVRVWRFERGYGVTLANMEAVAKAFEVPVRRLLP